jgi:hypothetical protein
MTVDSYAGAMAHEIHSVQSRINPSSVPSLVYEDTYNKDEDFTTLASTLVEPGAAKHRG